MSSGNNRGTISKSLNESLTQIVVDQIGEDDCETTAVPSMTIVGLRLD